MRERWPGAGWAETVARRIEQARDGRLMPTLAELEAVARGAAPPPLDAADRERIAAGRAVVEDGAARRAASSTA